jgi:hypothetical protein
MHDHIRCKTWRLLFGRTEIATQKRNTMFQKSSAHAETDSDWNPWPIRAEVCLDAGKTDRWRKLAARDPGPGCPGTSVVPFKTTS